MQSTTNACDTALIHIHRTSVIKLSRRVAHNPNPTNTMNEPNDVFILETEDYHEFSSAQKVLKAAGLRYNFKEIGMRGTNYRAMFYEGDEFTDELEIL
jgi:hypothetical protein